MGLGSGAAAGALATVPMSAVLAAARVAGMPGPLPPVLLVRRMRPGLTAPQEVVAGAVLHLAIGAVCGAAFAAVLRRERLAVPFGVAVWAAGYCLLMPAVGVLPPAWRDTPARQAPLLAAHVVFGAGLRALTGRR